MDHVFLRYKECVLENPGIRIPYPDAVFAGHENEITQVGDQLPGEGSLSGGENEWMYFIVR